MRLPKIRFRALLSFTLAVAIATVFSFSSLAAPEAPSGSDDVTAPKGAALVVATTGTFNCSGYGLLNGNSCRSGAAVLSDSLVSNTSSEIASVDLGQIGRVYLQPGASLRIVFDQSVARLQPVSKAVRFVVTHGALVVTDSSGAQTLGETESGLFSGKVVATLAGGTVITVARADDPQDKDQNKDKKDKDAGAALPGQNPPPTTPPPGGYNGPPWWGFLLLVGVAGGVAGGVASDSGDNRNKTPQGLSNPVP